MERVSLGKMQNPVRGFLHGSAAVVSLAVLVILGTMAVGGGLKVALWVYGVSLVALYTTSTLYHTLPWRPRWKAWWQRLDHTAIYVLVAGTATPLFVAVLDGVWMWAGLALMWGIGVVGTLREFVPALRQRWTVWAQVALGALCSLPMGLMLVRMDSTSRTLTIIGSVVYLGALVLFVMKRPRLFPRIFSHHEVFHVFVIAASVAHFGAVWGVVNQV